jgi:hypothetical protein
MMIPGPDILRAVDEREPRKALSSKLSLTPYRQAEPAARFLKSLIQMVIGIATLIAMAVQLIRAWSDGRTIVESHEQILELMGLALVLAAAVQLVYCLFVPGPGYALDPLALGVAAALLFQLADVRAFDARQGLAAALYVTALGGLLTFRSYLVKELPSTDWTIGDGVEQVRRVLHRRQQTGRRAGTRSRTKEGRHVATPAATVPAPAPATVPGAATTTAEVAQIVCGAAGHSPHGT